MNNIINGTTFETIATIYKAIFGQWCDYEDVNTISIEMVQLIEFQGQSIMLNWGNIFMDRDNHSIYWEIVKDIKNFLTYPFSPFWHIK